MPEIRLPFSSSSDWDIELTASGSDILYTMMQGPRFLSLPQLENKSLDLQFASCIWKLNRSWEAIACYGLRESVCVRREFYASLVEDELHAKVSLHIIPVDIVEIIQASNEAFSTMTQAIFDGKKKLSTQDTRCYRLTVHNIFGGRIGNLDYVDSEVAAAHARLRAKVEIAGEKETDWEEFYDAFQTGMSYPSRELFESFGLFIQPHVASADEEDEPTE